MGEGDCSLAEMTCCESWNWTTKGSAEFHMKRQAERLSIMPKAKQL